MVMAGFEEFATLQSLQFLLINLRWSGGAGFRTLEQRMEEAVRRLPISWDLLAKLLIEILEILDRTKHQKSRVHESLSDTAALGCCKIGCYIPAVKVGKDGSSAITRAAVRTRWQPRSELLHVPAHPIFGLFITAQS